MHDTTLDTTDRDTRDTLGESDGNEHTPEVVITTGQADVVRPGTTLTLDVSLPPDLVADIADWQWSVVQPTGSVITFQPSANIKNPTFQPWVVGDYVFELVLLDGAGRVRYSQSRRLAVVSGPGLHVELTWHTPGDPDEADTGGSAGWSAGSDVDLHLLHPLADGKFFQWTYDCYWENTRPNWGTLDPDTSPALDRDDTDGAGPEVISLPLPAPDATYRVGVHYWNDWSYGASLPTIRIYIDGILQDEWSDVRLVDGDMWESHEIDQTNGEVRRLTTEDGEPLITPMYPIVFEDEPAE